MKKAILATKVGMTQIFNEDGMLIPVTVLQAGPCVVTQVKTEKQEIISMLLQFPKVKASRAPSRDMASPEDLWLTVPNIIVMQVPMVLVLIRARYSKENTCQVIWEASR